MLNETWDMLEAPQVGELIHTTLDGAFDDLDGAAVETVWARGGANGDGQLPLAKVVPRLKEVQQKILLADLEENVLLVATAGREASDGFRELTLAIVLNK